MPAGNEPDVFFVCTRQFKFQEKLEAFLVAFLATILVAYQFHICVRSRSPSVQKSSSLSCLVHDRFVCWFQSFKTWSRLLPCPKGLGSKTWSRSPSGNAQEVSLNFLVHTKYHVWFNSRFNSWNATRNASSFSWNLNCLVHTKNTSGSFPAGILTRLDWALYC